MADFGDVNAELAKLSQKMKQKAAGVLPAATDTTPTAPAVEPKSNQPAPTPPVTSPTVQPPVATEPVIPPTEQPVAEEVIEPWDGTKVETKKSDEPFTLETISSALKIDGVKSKDDIVNHFTQREARIKELETAQDQQFADVPDDLKEVINVAKQKGDWKAFLGARIVDYSKTDPIGLFERQLELSPRFRKADGSIDYDAVDLELNSIPQAVKEVQGDIIKQNLISQQQQQRAAILQAADNKQAAFNRGVADAAAKIPSILSKEKIGVTMEAKHSDYLYQGIRNGSLVKKHFGNVDLSGADPDKLVRTLAAAEYLEGISQYQYKQGEVKGRKSMLSEKQNVNLNTPSTPVNPGVTTDKPKSAVEKLREKMGISNQPGAPRRL